MRNSRLANSVSLILFAAVTLFQLLCGLYGQTSMANNDYSGPTKCEMYSAAVSIPLLVVLLIWRRSIYFRLAVLIVILLAAGIFYDGYSRYFATPR